MKNGILSMVGKGLEADAEKLADEKKTLFGAAKLPEKLKTKKEK
ncbi:hypothetical protein P4H27_25745 [Paenibacillus taichungensis]|nr:hypothetical protein [Paenibacillus taichungensis]MEC0110377.1 hypothetical protein [Paenibacillus taichungensis]MEC0200053.1 hypothetical protein [Paenibacillus taichungensis]